MSFLDGKFYYPTQRVYGDPAEHGLVYEEVRFDCEEGVQLHGWWFPAVGDCRATVVHCHGNAGNVSGHFVHTAWLAKQGFNVLCFDYRGFGHSSGKPTRAGTIADAHGAIEFAKSRGDSQPVLLFGQSLGGAVAIVTASQNRALAGVAVDGPFSDYRQEAEWVLRQSWLTRGVSRILPRWGVSKGYDAIDAVERVAPTPLYIFHGMEDRIVPWEMSQDLYDRAGEPKGLWLVEGMDHDQALHELSDQARPKLVRFYQACLEADSITRHS
jgi:alpha-beta hydrolase superfamily lysophospholipase